MQLNDSGKDDEELNIQKIEKLETSRYFHFATISFVALVMLLAWIGTGTNKVFASESDYEYRAVAGGVEITGYRGSETELTILETLGGQPVVRLGILAFFAKNLQSVVLPDTLESIGDFVFENNGLTRIEIGKNVTSIGGAPLLDNPLTQITVATENPNYKSIAGQGLYTIDGKKLIQGTTSGEIVAGTEEVGQYALTGLGIEHISIPSSVTHIARSAFRDNRLTSIYIPDSVTNMESWAFADNQLNSVHISESVTSIEDYLFYRNELSDVIIPEHVKSIGMGAFTSNQLTNAVLSDALESLANAAFRDNNLTHISIPESVTSVGGSVFAGNPLTELIVAEENLNYKDINNKGLYTRNGKKLVQGTISGEIAAGTEEIGMGAFERMGLESIAIPSSVTSIGNIAFTKNQLTQVVFPDQVTSIGSSAFSNNQLTSVVFGENINEIWGDAFSNNLLESISIGKNVSLLSSTAFSYNPLTQITVVADNSSYRDIDGEGVYTKDGKTLVLGTTNGIIAFGTEVIKSSSFVGMGIEHIIIPDSVNQIECTSFFDNPLKSIVIPASVTIIGDNLFPISSDLMIFGEIGSVAETYARDHNIRFLELSEPLMITIEPNESSNQWFEEAITNVTIHGIGPLELSYYWSTDLATPPRSAEWLPFVDSEEITTINDGKWYLHIYVKDGRGDEWYAHSDLFLVDHTPPTLEIRMKQGEQEKDYDEGAWTNESVGVSIQATDTFMQHMQVKIEHDGTVEEIPVDASDNYLFERLFTENGIYRLEITAADESGKTSVEQRTIKISKDGLHLESALKHADDSVYTSGMWSKESVTATVYVYHTNGITVTSSAYSLDEGASWINYSTPLTFTEEGSHALWFKAEDEAGNEMLEQHSVRIDKTLPEIQSNPNGSDAASPQEEVASIITVIDSISGVNLSSLKYKWSLSPNMLEDELQAEWQSFQSGDRLSHADEPGVWYLHISAQDMAGNINYVISEPFHLDNPMDHNAFLSALQVDAQSVPAFSPNHYVYTLNVEHSRSIITITPTAEADTAAIYLRLDDGEYFAVPSGTATIPLSLYVGDNKINIKVVASDAATTITYIVNIVRAADQGGNGDGGSGGSYIPSSNARLSDLVLSEGRLTPNFAEHITEYTARVANHVDRITINLKTVHGYATLKVNGEAISNDQQVAQVLLEDGKNKIEILVTAEDGTQKTYTLTIEREKTKADELETPPPSFTDIAGHWAERWMNEAIEQGLINGYPDGTFKPNHPITRAEFTVMLVGALQLDGTGATLTFTDAAQIEAWAKQAVAIAVQSGIITGYDDGSFRPNAQITRAEMAVMIARMMQLPMVGGTTTDFADDEDIPKWAKEAVEAIRKLGIVSGRGGDRFVPNDTATRAEATIMLLRMLELRD